MLFVTCPASALAISEQAKLVASDAGYHDLLGTSIAVSGDTVVVGANLHESLGYASGAAYVFFREGASWTQQAKLVGSDTNEGDSFGLSVAISGDTIVVGAYRHDVPSPTWYYNQGAAYVFVREGSTWTQQAKLTASDAVAFDEFGRSVAISGDTIVVGAHESDALGEDSGAAYVFVRSDSAWSEQARLLSRGDAFDHFGASVATSGETIVVGAPYSDSVPHQDLYDTAVGSAYVFVKSGSTWVTQAKLSPVGPGMGSAFGVSVSVSGETILVGAPGASAGVVFVRRGSLWYQRAVLTNPQGPPTNVGGSVAISGDVAVLGAPTDTQAGLNAGATYVFRKDVGTDWNGVTVLVPSDAAAGYQSGYSVSVDGGRVVLGARHAMHLGMDVGAAYVFDA